MNPQTQNKLAATATATYTEITNLAEDLTLPASEYPLAQIIETLDDRICPLCQFLHGKIIQRGTPEWEQYRLPSHINCRRTFAYISQEDAPDNPPDFTPPPQDLLQKHGHFHTDPHRYEPLRVPAYADRRQFILIRTRDPQTGALQSILSHLTDIDDIIERILASDDLFTIPNFPRLPRKPATPNSPDELAATYAQHTQEWETFYTQLNHLIQNLDAIANQPITDETSFTRAAHAASAAARIRRNPIIFQREQQHLLTIFQSPNPVRHIPHKLQNMTQEEQETIRQLLKQARLFISKGHNTPPVTIIIAPIEREFYNPSRDTIVISRQFFSYPQNKQLSTLIHEYHHHLERHNPELHAKALSLYAERTRGQQPIPLQRFNARYEPHELTIPDDFPGPYMGKLYLDAQGNQTDTEILTQYHDYIFSRLRQIENRTVRSETGTPVGYKTTIQDELHTLMTNPKLTSLWRGIWLALHGQR
jgi:hypothetical protein